MCSIEVFVFGGVVPVLLPLMFISYLMCSLFNSSENNYRGGLENIKIQ